MKGRGQKELKFQDEFSYVDSSTTCNCRFTQKTNALVREGLSCIHSCMFLVTGPMTKEMSHMLSSLQVSYCRETKLSVVSLRTQAVKLHKNFDHLRYSLRVNKNKKHLGCIFFLP